MVVLKKKFNTIMTMKFGIIIGDSQKNTPALRGKNEGGVNVCLENLSRI